MKVKIILKYLLFACLLLLNCKNEIDQSGEQHSTWSDTGGGPDQSRYFEQEQITKENVSNLKEVFSYPTQDDQSYHVNPVIVDSVMYIMGKNSSLIAINATDGKELWIHANLHGLTRRGINYWQSKDGEDSRILFTIDHFLQAIDARTGKSILTFGKNGLVDLREGLGRDPKKISRIASRTPGRIFEDLILLGSSPGESYGSAPGHLRAYNVRTGDLKWIFHTIPKPGEFGYDTWPPDAYKYVGGTNCWGEISVDEQRGIAYFPLGSPTYDYYGADRIGKNLFANCLLALDARSGERLWHFQTVHHDLWDYDLASAPQLITVNHSGNEMDAVALATKQGFLFAFDRVTGKPLWPIEERPVPASEMPGEEAWPTQPFPTVIPPFSPQVLNPEDISPLFLSDEELAKWHDRVSEARRGLYQPISTIETIAMPGATGGNNFGNSAANPPSGLVYVMSQSYPSFYRLDPLPPTVSRYHDLVASEKSFANGEQLYSQYCQSCHGRTFEGNALGISLLEVIEGLELGALIRTVNYGVGRMPPLKELTEEQINDILIYLKEEAENIMSEVEIPLGPVVESGGVPRPEPEGRPIYNPLGDEYPNDVEVPTQRFYTDYGLGYPYLINPPWSTITAYDLNLGKMVWTRPLGELDPSMVKGARNTGVPNGSQRNGMIVTSNGLVFSTVSTGQIYAYDAQDGSILWMAQLPRGIGALPAMYQVNGRVYIVVNATDKLPEGWNNIKFKDSEKTSNRNPGSYVVYSLPENLF